MGWASALPDGVIASGDAMALDCENTLLWSYGERQKLIVLGLKDVIDVAMSDTMPVADRSRSQDVKKGVDALRAQGAAQADTFARTTALGAGLKALSI